MRNEGMEKKAQNHASFSTKSTFQTNSHETKDQAKYKFWVKVFSSKDLGSRNKEDN